MAEPDQVDTGSSHATDGGRAALANVEEPPVLRGITRMRQLWRLWRSEREDPEPFYTVLAREGATDLERRYGPLNGQTILDMGCGPGYYTSALRDNGATVIPLDNSREELELDGPAPEGAILADATDMPIADDSVDGVFSSNMLEHTPDPAAVFDEIERVLRPGGWAYLSWTNWWSPWGGHDISPYHYLGLRLGLRMYERLHGVPRKNRPGEALFPVHIGPTLRDLRSRPGIMIDSVEPRYWPWLAFITQIPLLREVATWNCVVRLQKHRVNRPVPDDALTDRTSFVRTLDEVRDVPGWLRDEQARHLWDAASRVPGRGQIVEIGSYQGRSTIVLASAVPDDVAVVSIDPHAGNDRGPGEWEGSPEDGRRDHLAFERHLRTCKVADRVRHLCTPSGSAHREITGEIDLLYVDGSHRLRNALSDLRGWGSRVREGGTMLVHDTYASVFVTAAIYRSIALSSRWRYMGRVRSLAEYRREEVCGGARIVNVVRQLAGLPWFARNLAVKALCATRLERMAVVFGHRAGDDVY